MSDKDGGPAFPYSETKLALDGRSTSQQTITHGMTLRDYFAAAALQGIIGAVWNSKPFVGHDSLASAAYLAADAMLKERAK